MDVPLETAPPLVGPDELDFGQYLLATPFPPPRPPAAARDDGADGAGPEPIALFANESADGEPVADSEPPPRVDAEAPPARAAAWPVEQLPVEPPTSEELAAIRRRLAPSGPLFAPSAPASGNDDNGERLDTMFASWESGLDALRRKAGYTSDGAPQTAAMAAAQPAWVVLAPSPIAAAAAEPAAADERGDRTESPNTVMTKLSTAGFDVASVRRALLGDDTLSQPVPQPYREAEPEPEPEPELEPEPAPEPKVEAPRPQPQLEPEPEPGPQQQPLTEPQTPNRSDELREAQRSPHEAQIAEGQQQIDTALRVLHNMPKLQLPAIAAAVTATVAAGGSDNGPPQSTPSPHMVQMHAGEQQIEAALRLLHASGSEWAADADETGSEAEETDKAAADRMLEPEPLSDSEEELDLSVECEADASFSRRSGRQEVPAAAGSAEPEPVPPPHAAWSEPAPVESTTAASLANITNTTGSAAAWSEWAEERCRWPATISTKTPPQPRRPPGPAEDLPSGVAAADDVDDTSKDEATTKGPMDATDLQEEDGISRGGMSRMELAMQRVAEEHASYAASSLKPMPPSPVAPPPEEATAVAAAARAAVAPGNLSTDVSFGTQATPHMRPMDEQSMPATPSGRDDSGLPAAYLTIYGKLRAAKAMAPSPQRKELLQALYNMGSALLKGQGEEEDDDEQEDEQPEVGYAYDDEIGPGVMEEHIGAMIPTDAPPEHPLAAWSVVLEPQMMPMAGNEKGFAVTEVAAVGDQMPSVTAAMALLGHQP